jgi:hypothetical protein
MPDFNVRSDSVDVEQIMEQIRARIREKRGVDYTEEQIRELAAVKLEKFLDPRGVRSDLLEQFLKAQPAYTPPELPNYAFEAQTLYESTRPPIRWMRKLLNPILKLFFNPNPLIQALNIQSRLNTMYGEREARREATRRAFDQLQYELMHNLVIETTRMSIEVKNLKMRVESLASRLEFNERRARALESVVVYKASGDAAPEPMASANAGRPSPLRETQGRPEQGRGTSSGQPWTPREPQGRSDSGRGAVNPTQASPSAQPFQEPQERQEPGRAMPIPGSGAAGQGPSAGQGAGEGPGQRSRRRRRRRGRRGGGSAAAIMGGITPTQPPIAESGSTEPLSGGSASVPEERLEAPPASSGPSTHSEREDRDDPPTLREPQGRPEPGRGTTGSGQSDPQ